MKSVSVMRQQLLARAAEDRDFRKWLLADPVAAIESELGMKIPKNVEIVIHEDTQNLKNVVLPPNMDLTTEELAMVAGGGGPMYGRDGVDTGANED